MKKIMYLLSIGLMVTLLGCGTTTTTKETPAPITPPTTTAPSPVATPAPAPVPVPTPAPVVAPANKPTMTKAEFDQLKDGMSYEDATKIIGGPGEVMSESGSKGDPAHTVMYTYKGEGDLGANANLMFQGDKLMNKAQFGLK